MNQLVQQTIAEDAPEKSQLITIKPEAYVTQVFSPFQSQLRKAIKEHATTSTDVTTTSGMSAAVAARKTFRELRLEAEKARKDRKAPIIEIGKLLDSKCKDLQAQIEPHELKFDHAIKAEEERKEAEKQAKIAAERARVERIQNAIQDIRNQAILAADFDSERIAKRMAHWSGLTLIPEVYEEFLEDALSAVNATIVELGKMHTRALEREAAEVKAKLEREELARLREETAKREQEESARLTALAQEAQRQREAHEAEMDAMRRELAESKALIERQEAERTATYKNSQQRITTIEIVPVSVKEEKKNDSSIEEIDLTEKYVPTPSKIELVSAISCHFNATEEIALRWLRETDFSTE